MASSNQTDTNDVFCAAAEDFIASDLDTSIDDMLSGLHNFPNNLPLLPEGLLSSFIYDEPQSTTDSPVSLQCEPTPPLSLCEHNGCHFNSWKNVFISFARMDQTKRIRIVRGMLFATTAAQGKHNSLSASSASAWRREAKRRRLDDTKETRSNVIYAIKGNMLCRTAFASLVSLQAQTVQRHTNRVVNGSEALYYDSQRKLSRKDKHGIQRLILRGFFAWYGSSFGMECPHGRGSHEEEPLRLLPSSTTKAGVHDSYCDSWSSLTGAVESLINAANPPSVPLSYSLFLRYWEKDAPTLRITKSGSDFCDFCTTIKGSIACLKGEEEQLQTLKEVLENHRKEAKEEFLFYKQCQHQAHQDPNGATQHFVFDFAEKVLLPKLQNQPGQLHFITGLKFDLFGVSSSNEGTNYVFGLPEGHWPNEKTANVVISMLHHVLEKQKSDNAPGAFARHLRLHADNCAGQNKNRFVLWYLCWRVLMGLNDSIELCFLIAGHTKNVCDGAFGHVKRRLQQTNTHSPSDMMTVIENSSCSTKCVPSAHVDWKNWKSMLSPQFKIPSGLAITKFHVFKFDNDNLGFVSCRRLTTEETSKRFALSSIQSLGAFRSEWESRMRQGDFKSFICPLEDVVSTHHRTRKQYLEVNILDRYYANDCHLREQFFGNGANYEHQ